MRGLILTACIALVVAAPAAQAQVSVDGYVTRNGQYVQPYQRTAPNSSIYDNYSTRPNVNPYSGQQGTVNPYATPSPSYNYGTSPSYSSPYSNPYSHGTPPRRY